MALRKRIERPRELSGFHVGGMLYGDWGTSKAYVLGIAFALAGHASVVLLGAMSLLTAVVGICYIIVCRTHPDGGGVYSSVRNRSPLMSVTGALLLVADYAVTAALSALVAFHYFGAAHPLAWAVGAIILIGLLNWIGQSKSGTVAMWIAGIATACVMVLVLFSLPSLRSVHMVRPQTGMWTTWTQFVGVILALSGVESVANLTGVMERPVGRTSRLAIWPVLVEVSLFTFLLGLAMNAIPGLGADHIEDMLRVLGVHYVSPWFGSVIGVVFGLLLLSASNTAISSLVSIQFLMAKDGEWPESFANLNRFGMPWLALVVGTLIPAVLLVCVPGILDLAHLYAIGVVGAICMNLLATGTDRTLSVRPWERWTLLVTGAFLLAVEVTIAVIKPSALLFAILILGTGLGLRVAAKRVARRRQEPQVPEINVLTLSEAKEVEPLYHSSTLVALRFFNRRLLEEAVLRLKAKHENALYLVYVEPSPATRELPEEMEPSRDSVQLLKESVEFLETNGITGVPIWRMGMDPGRLVANTARELSADTVMIGATKRSALLRLLRTDVIMDMMRHLPSTTKLLICG